MLLRSKTVQALFLVVAMILIATGPASAQFSRVVDFHVPYALPFYAPSAYPAPLGDVPAQDVAGIFPALLYRPMDDLTPRPGADAIGMGGANVARSSGVMSLGWNPAGLAGMREKALAIDGIMVSSSGRMTAYPDTIFLEEQPEFRITGFDDRERGFNGFGFAGVAGPLFNIGDRPLVGGFAYRRHTEVAFGNETVVSMELQAGTGFPFVFGSDTEERGSINAYTVGLAYDLIDTDELSLSAGATANFLEGRLRSETELRVNVQGYDEGYMAFQRNYNGFSVEMGAQAEIREKVRLGAWASLPYDLESTDSRYSYQELITPADLYVIRLYGDIVDFTLEIPAFYSGGVSVGPFYGVEVSADVNYRPWSETKIRYPDLTVFDPLGGFVFNYGDFDGPYPMEDVTSFHVGSRFEFPFFKSWMHRSGMHLDMQLGFRTLPLSMAELDLVDGEGAFRFGDQVEGQATGLGFSLDTGMGMLFHMGVELQNYKYKKWLMDDTRNPTPDEEQWMGEVLDHRELMFNDPWARSSTVDRGVTVFRLSSEMNF